MKNSMPACLSLLFTEFAFSCSRFKSAYSQIEFSAFFLIYFFFQLQNVLDQTCSLHVNFKKEIICLGFLPLVSPEAE